MTKLSIKEAVEWAEGKAILKDVYDSVVIGIKGREALQTLIDGVKVDEGRMVEIVKDKLLNTPIGGDWDKTRAIYVNEKVCESLAKSIVKAIGEGI